MLKKTEAEVLAVVEQALQLSNGAITKESSMANVAEWDSLGHLSILSALDKLFGGKIGGIKEMAEANTVEKMLITLKNNSLV